MADPQLPAPMLAKAIDRIPVGEFGYEPKWDGFRAIISNTAGDVQIGSRGARSLTRYFPELVSAFARQLPAKVILDGEIIVPAADGSGHLDFSALQQRIHPAASRITKLATETPASFVAFDLLAVDGQDLLALPFLHRRGELERVFASLAPPLFLTVMTREVQEAQRWFAEFEGAGLDGVVAKSLDEPYRPDERAMFKIKHHRTADCVVGGIRRHKNDSHAIGALLLGLHDERGRLHYVGSTSSFSMEIRREMMAVLEPLIVTSSHPWTDEGDEDVRRPGAISRWSGARDRTFDALDPVLVCEVRYDQIEGDRFRHTTTFLRWRPDRRANECGYDQLEIPTRYDLSSVLR